MEWDEQGNHHHHLLFPPRSITTITTTTTTTPPNLPSLQSKIAVKLLGCSRGAPYPFPGSHWLQWAGIRHPSNVALAQPSYLRNSACSENIVGLRDASLLALDMLCTVLLSIINLT